MLCKSDKPSIIIIITNYRRYLPYVGMCDIIDLIVDAVYAYTVYTSTGCCDPV